MTNNQLAENSITQLLNSVKLARDNAERDDNRVDHSFYYALAIALEELQERRKAAMDSEPVAEVCEDYAIRYISNGPAPVEGLHPGDKLYRHAQPVPASEPVADDGIFRPGDAVGVFNVGCETCPDHLVAWTVKGQNLPSGNYWLYISQQPAPVVPDERYQHLSELYHAQEKRLFKLLKRVKGPEFDKYSHTPLQAIDFLESAFFGDSEDDARAAMLQAGNSPVIPDGYVMVPKEPTQAMCAAFNDSDYGRKSLRERYVAMLAAAPQPQNEPQNIPEIIPGWIPVSERMPEESQHIIIFCDGAFVLSAQYRDGEFFDVVRDGDEFFETTSRCVTHWMPLPAAPQEVSNG